MCREFSGHRWIPLKKGQWRGALMFSLICAWTNSWVNTRDNGDLRRHRAHYCVTVMYCMGYIVQSWACLPVYPVIATPRSSRFTPGNSTNVDSVCRIITLNTFAATGNHRRFLLLRGKVVQLNPLVLKNVAIISKVWFSKSVYRIVTWALDVELLSGGQRSTTLIRNKHWFR